MDSSLLGDYLNDHLAGSVIAIEMGQHLRDEHADDRLKSFIDVKLAEIEQDRIVLKRLIDQIGGEQSTAKKSLAWLTEKIGRLKTGGGGSEREIAFQQLEQLETLMLGVRGKLALWELLERIAESDDRLAGFDWADLKQRAKEQIAAIDEERVGAGMRAFGASDSL